MVGWVSGWRIGELESKTNLSYNLVIVEVEAEIGNMRGTDKFSQILSEPKVNHNSTQPNLN